MHSFYVNLHSVQEIRTFTEIACSFPFEITVSDGSRSFNGKSLMSFFCLDPAHPMRVEACCTDEQFGALCESVSRFRTF